MAFKTNWEPGDVLGEVEKIIRNNGVQLRNIDDRVEVNSDKRNGYIIDADSTTGHFHDTKVNIEIKQDPNKGSLVHVTPKYGTSSEEAQEIEDKLKSAYFDDGRVR